MNVAIQIFVFGFGSMFLSYITLIFIWKLTTYIGSFSSIKQGSSLTLNKHFGVSFIQFRWSSIYIYMVTQNTNYGSPYIGNLPNPTRYRHHHHSNPLDLTTHHPASWFSMRHTTPRAPRHIPPNWCSAGQRRLAVRANRDQKSDRQNAAIDKNWPSDEWFARFAPTDRRESRACALWCWVRPRLRRFDKWPGPKGLSLLSAERYTSNTEVNYPLLSPVIEIW